MVKKKNNSSICYEILLHVKPLILLYSSEDLPSPCRIPLNRLFLRLKERTPHPPTLEQIPFPLDYVLQPSSSWWLSISGPVCQYWPEMLSQYNFKYAGILYHLEFLYFMGRMLMHLSLPKDTKNIHAYPSDRGGRIAFPRIFFFLLHRFSEILNWFQINEPSVRDNVALSHRTRSALSAAAKLPEHALQFGWEACKNSLWACQNSRVYDAILLLTLS